MPTVTIEPNVKYDAVFGTDYAINTDDRSRTSARVLREEYEREYSQAVEAYEAIEDDVEDRGYSLDHDVDGSLWHQFNVAKDPDLLAKIATYFDGVDATEPTDLIRAKLRLLDGQVYANAQIATEAELREQSG
ncbi:hypothetical protein [Natronobacterium gregoryi]|uniref:Uncharacterized protein n=2 Tax=Natronobacterium gregoryi TaxID=44930 RepID=L0AKW8_NATGS|nr:hypothetical protein [Natronobacterium gregoryi]AFZ74543.1 hypothetical protein Natgr_3424 [Natronobacterium gregoryi SP2]ELY72385.1 hypothetical protein C490_03538 [Natronobacterium gregoryi SP2]PLK21713.1 hypothetical protein CYV19_02430 [Natronobacterium gregoryi SP2]SFI96710.1 hypothetical protein SAMN05443661_110162 [Natronobacterium gregoryi]